MSATYEATDDYTVCISDAGQARLATDQRMNGVVGVHTAILIGASIGLVVTFGALVVTKILGA